MNVIYRPIDFWPRAVDKQRPHSPFRANYTETLQLLERECRQLGADQVIVELAIHEDDLRRDGKPYAGAHTSHPGVIVAFESDHGPLKYTADKFATWTENVRAIALGLEALRKVDRYGMTSRGEQYSGWKALPSGSQSEDLVDRGRQIISEHGGDARAALAATHPDRPGVQDDRDFKAVNAARQAHA